MLTITRDLNVYSSGMPPIISLSQYDSDFQLVFNLYTSEGTLNIPSGTTAQIQGTKRDGNGYSASATISGNTVTVTGHNQMTACAGANVFEISLINSGKVMNTINFILAVEPAAMDAGTIQSETVLKELQAIIDGAATSTQAAQDAEDAADRAEEAARSLTVDPTLTQSGQPADAKVTGDEINDLKEDLSDTEDWLGYTKNLFNARAFKITNTSNWSIDSATKTAITITHKTTYSTGQPIAPLSLPSGDYVFHADYSQSAIKLSLKQGDTWFGELTDGVEFAIDDTIENKIYFSSSVVATYTITGISISPKTASGKISSLESVTQRLESTVAKHDVDIEDLTTGFAQITDPVISSIDGTETQNQAITSTGSLVAGGTNNYRTVRYAVTVGKKYYINASTNYGNRLWCFYDANNNVVELGTRSEAGSAFTDITDAEAIVPTNASYLVIAYHSQHTLGDVKTQTGLAVAKKWVGKKWVCVGDSLTAVNDRTTKHYFDYVAEETGITTVNMGDSGSGYAREQEVGTAFYQRISDCPVDADVVTIFGSFNDLGAGLPIGSVDDTGTTTLAGCINTTIDNLQTVIPLVNLGIVAPTPWDTTQPTTSGNAYNYVEMLKAICERRSIPFLDLWRGSNLRPWDSDFRALAYSKDGGSGTHPDENGHKLIAPRFEGFLDTLLL